MTLLDEIRAKCSPELLASRNTFAIADKVNVGRKKLTKTALGIGTFLSVFEHGGTFMRTLEQIAAAGGTQGDDIHYALDLVRDGRLDLSDQKLQDQLSELASHQALAAHAVGIARLKALGYTDDHVTEFDVRCACYADNGDWKP